MKDVYLKLKINYDLDNKFSSSHDFKHESFTMIEKEKEKEKFLPIILEQLKSSPTWFDIVFISFIITTPMPDVSINGKFDKLCDYYIKYLTKYIRKMKLKEINNK